ncbi:MAG: DNA alkylation repair protein [Candidatus Fimenecus sp.]
MFYSQMQWSADIYTLFLEDLHTLADSKYKAFHERLCKTAHAEILGVRTPDIKRVAKEIAKGDADGFLALCGDTYYEELLIKGFVLGFQKKPLSKKRENLDAFVLQIDNWAVCDGFCAALKPKQAEYPYLYDWCCSLLQTTGEYTRRTAIVLMMAYLLCDEYIDRVLECLQAVNCDCYYVHMAVAWCLSMCFVKYREKTLNLLTEHVFDKATHNKAIQKCIESYRVSDADKAYLRTLKR